MYKVLGSLLTQSCDFPQEHSKRPPEMFNYKLISEQALGRVFFFWTAFMQGNMEIYTNLDCHRIKFLRL